MTNYLTPLVQNVVSIVKNIDTRGGVELDKVNELERWSQIPTPSNQHLFILAFYVILRFFLSAFVYLPFFTEVALTSPRSHHGRLVVRANQSIQEEVNACLVDSLLSIFELYSSHRAHNRLLFAQVARAYSPLALLFFYFRSIFLSSLLDLQFGRKPFATWILKSLLGWGGFVRRRRNSSHVVQNARSGLPILRKLAQISEKLEWKNQQCRFVFSDNIGTISGHGS